MNWPAVCLSSLGLGSRQDCRLLGHGRGKLASFSFTMSALFTDLFMIRSWLLCAYTCLFVNAVLGSPLWPDVFYAGHVFDPAKGRSGNGVAVW